MSLPDAVDEYYTNTTEISDDSSLAPTHIPTDRPTDIPTDMPTNRPTQLNLISTRDISEVKIIANSWETSYNSYSIDFYGTFYVDKVFSSSDENINLISETWEEISAEYGIESDDPDFITLLYYYQIESYSDDASYNNRRLSEVNVYNYILNVTLNLECENADLLDAFLEIYSNIFGDFNESKQFSDEFENLASIYSDEDGWDAMLLEMQGWNANTLDSDIVNIQSGGMREKESVFRLAMHNIIVFCLCLCRI